MVEDGKDGHTERVVFVATMTEQHAKVDLVWAVVLVEWQGTDLTSPTIM